MQSRFGGQLLQESGAFHKSLERIFGEGKEMLFSELTDDGSVFCLLELLASQQVTISSPSYLRILMRQITLRPASEKFDTGHPLPSYRGRAAGNPLSPRTKLMVDKTGFDFGVIVSATSEFKPNAWLLPSDKLPTREADEPQTWISLNDQSFDKTLANLKEMIFTFIYLQPGIQKVTPPQFLISSFLSSVHCGDGIERVDGNIWWSCDVEGM